MKFVASSSTSFFFSFLSIGSHIRRFSLDEAAGHVSTHHCYSCQPEPKAKSIWLASITVETWHRLHCHLVKTKKPKEVLPLSFHMRERPDSSIPAACLHPQYAVTQTKCCLILCLILNRKCCTEIVRWSNHMTHFLYFPVDSQRSCSSACMFYCR